MTDSAVVSMPRWRNRQPSMAIHAGLSSMALLLAALQWTLVFFSEDAMWNIVLAVGWSMLAAWYLGSLVRRRRAGERVGSQYGDGASWWHL